MNALTKTFVLLVTILAVVLVALVVPFVANTENYKAQRDSLQTEVTSLKATARLLQSEINALQTQQSEQIIALRTQNLGLTQNLDKQSTAVKDAQSEIEQLRAETARLKADMSRMTAAQEQALQITGALQTELKERRAESQDQAIRAIELADRNNLLQSQLDAMSNTLRRTKEQMADMQSQNAELERLIATLPPDIRNSLGSSASAERDLGPVEPESPIRGQIVRVENLEGDTLAKINVGTNDGVTENMKFLVHRGSKFLGSLVITNVAEQEAAGRIILQQEPINSGDEVWTGGL